MQEGPGAGDAGGVRYAAVARLGDGKLAASHAGPGRRGVEVSERAPRARPAPLARNPGGLTAGGGLPGAQEEGTVRKVLASGNLQRNQQLTVTVSEELGTLHLQTGDAEVLAVMCSTAYPRRKAFEMLRELQAGLAEVAGPEALAAMANEGDLNRYCQGMLRAAIKKYGDLAAVDKVAAMGLKVEEVKTVMEGNINRVLQNAENLESVENKTEQLRSTAQTFQKKSENVKKALWWRNFKVKLILFILITCIVLYITLPLIVKAIRKE